MKRSHPFSFPITLRRPPRLRGFAWIRGLSWIRDLGFGCLARGDGEWLDRPRLSLPPSPEHVRANSPVEFTQDYLFPSPPYDGHPYRPTRRTSSRKSEGTGLTPEDVKELRRATDLALRATKHTARAVGRPMAGSVATERHLWLNLTEISEKEEVFLLDAPISQSGLFGEAISGYQWRNSAPPRRRTFTKCMDAALAPLRLQGIRVLNYLDNWLILAHSRELVSCHRDIVLCHSHSLGLRMNAKKSVLLPSQRTMFLGVHLDSIQMQACLAPARISNFTACLARFKLGRHVSVGSLPQAARPHGSGLSCVAPRVASHEAIPLVDKGAEVTPHCTSHSPYQGVARLLSIPFTMAGPRFSSERGKNRCDSPSPYGRDGRINDGLGSSLRRQTGERGMDRRVPLLAHKLPGTQGCLPGFDVFSPRPRGASYHSQDGQHAGCVPHKLSGRFTVAHPRQACAPSSPWSQYKFLSLRAVHVPGILNLAADFLSRQKLRPGEWMLNHQTVSQIWDLFGKAEVDLFASQESSQCQLWFSLSSPTTLGIDAFAHPWPNVMLYAFPPIKLIPAVLCRVKVSSARLLLIAPFWPSQTWFSELTPLLYRSTWEIPIRRDLLSQLQSRIWHPQPELWKLWVWPIQGQGLWWMF